MGTDDRDGLWGHVHAERSALADDLARLTPEQWRHRTLCWQWDVEDVVAHLVAAALTGRWGWIRSIVGARFRPDVHNERRIAEHKGRTPEETLARFRAAVSSTIAPTGHTAAYLGEVVVHAQDVRQPLGLPTRPSVDALTPVAEFFAKQDFAVSSRKVAAGLELVATDGPFRAGSGPRVEGPTLALVMAMAGRPAYLGELEGPGLDELRSRVAPGDG